MANNRLVFEGLPELLADLRALPAALVGEGGHIVEASANGAAVTVRTVYGQHRRSGDLQDHVTVEHHHDASSTSAVVKSSGAHAWLFDNGSQARHWASGKSTGTMWGTTPPTHVFVVTMIRARRAMYQALRELLERHGLTVTGDAE